MARPKYTPDKRTLEKAYRLTKNKKVLIKDLPDRLGISYSQWELNRDVFNSYFKQRRIHDQHTDYENKYMHPDDGERPVIIKKGSIDKKPPKWTKLVIEDINLERLKSYSICGYNKETIASLLCISRTTLFNYEKQFPSIHDILTNSRKRASEEMIAALHKTGIGHKYTEQEAKSVPGVGVKIVTVKKYAKPKVSAQKYWLSNSEQWTSEPKTARDNNRGSILATLDRLVNDDMEDNEE